AMSMARNAPDPALTTNWGFPTDMRVGPGRLAELPEICRDLGFERPLLVTDQGLREQPMMDGLLAGLESAGFSSVGIFSDIQGDPDWATVETGINAFRNGPHDGIIAFGGGSSLDTAKAIALMVGQTRPIWDFEDAGNWKRAAADAIVSVIAIPTTAGTGSEVGRSSVITNTERE